MSPARRLVAIVALALLAAACGDDDDVDPAVSGEVPGADDDGGGSDRDGPADITVVARDIAFDVERIELEAGRATTIRFENDDEGIQHNLHVEAGAVDVETDITAGPDTQTLELTVDEAGDYTFVCDVHPSMTGEVIVS